MESVLRAVSVRKRFAATEALCGVDVGVRRGEVVGLLGENGAGKSTLVGVVSGEVEPDEGEVLIGGARLRPPTPHRASELGVAVIHQELNYVPPLSVAENIALGRMPRRGRARFLVDRSRMRAEAAAALADLAPGIDVRRSMASLRVADRQLVEIARALTRGARVVLMDEPTAALNAQEAARLFTAVRSLAQRGVGIVYISHRLEEVLALADRIVVLRDGRVVGEHEAAAVDHDRLVREIVGRDLASRLRSAPSRPAPVGPVRLELRHVASQLGLQEVTVNVHRGEVLGFYGLAGSGVEHLAKSIVGAIPCSGDVRVDGRSVRRRSPSRCRESGVVLVPADRRHEGILPRLSVGTNVSLGRLADRGAWRFAHPRADRRLGAEWAERVDLRPPDPRVAVGRLSGGNQQKSVFARWLATEPRVLVLDEPTRGVDVGAKSQMYQLIEGAAAGGAGVVVVSPELPELLAICHRIGVVHRGRLAGVYARADVVEDDLVAIAIGGAA